MGYVNQQSKITTAYCSDPVNYAIGFLERDIKKVFKDTNETGIAIKLQPSITPMRAESYTVEVTNAYILLTASDDLGFVYGLLDLSKKYLGIAPFWFWMDQEIQKIDRIEVAVGSYVSPEPRVRYRGWFLNDEVLLMKWQYNQANDEGWLMAFEALLRCGGNMVVPGTDKMARSNRALATQMGLWLTHHHAEPLGAELFVRRFPTEEPNILEHAEQFYQLWEEAVKEQKNEKIIWNVGFRGQGDMPFWASDTTGRFDTPERQGALISKIIEEQCQLVRRYVEKPIFCTNLYGEVMELYDQGHIRLDKDIIKVRADNGFGKMVTRRRDLHTVRVSSMPDATDKDAQGIYYHVSFYDLQAANHLTMLPNCITFVDKELESVLENGGNTYWLINCSNIRPHTYYLDAIRRKWYGEQLTDCMQAQAFSTTYFENNAAVAACYVD